MKTPFALRTIRLALVLMLLLSGCMTDFGDIPTEYTIDTGQGLLDAIAAARVALLEAEAKFGAEARDTIAQATANLNVLASEVIALVGDRLSATITQFDLAIQAKLIWIDQQVAQIHAYALSIIHATGEEAREIIETAEIGLQRTIRETQEAIDKTFVGFTQGGILVVTNVADRILSVGGIALGLLLLFLAARMWGRLVYSQGFPAEGGRRVLSFVLMGVTFLFALAPLILLFRPVRAAVLVSANQASEIKWANTQVAQSPWVDRFVPEPVVASEEHRAAGLVIHGSNLTSALGLPEVSFGQHSLQVTGSDRQLRVEIGPVIEHPVADTLIRVHYGATGTATFEASVAVWTPSPTITPSDTPTITPTPTQTHTPTHVTIEPTPTPTRKPTRTPTPITPAHECPTGYHCSPCVPFNKPCP